MNKKSLDIHSAIEWLKSGKILAHPTESIWGLGCDAFNKAAVQKIFQLKKRNPSKNFILLCNSQEFLYKYLINLSAEDKNFLSKNWPGPVTFLLKYNENLPEHLHTKNGKIAVRVSNHLPIKLLFNRFKGFIVSTSANLSGEEIINNPDDIVNFFESDDLAYYDERLGKNIKPSKIIDLESRSIVRN